MKPLVLGVWPWGSSLARELSVKVLSLGSGHLVLGKWCPVVTETVTELQIPGRFQDPYSTSRPFSTPLHPHAGPRTSSCDQCLQPWGLRTRPDCSPVALLSVAASSQPWTCPPLCKSWPPSALCSPRPQSHSLSSQVGLLQMNRQSLKGKTLVGHTSDQTWQREDDPAESWVR